MKALKTLLIIGLGTLLLTGCAKDKRLFFGQAQTVGIDISTTPQPGLTLGYKDVNIAIIPVSGEDGSMYGGSQCDEFAPAPGADSDYQVRCDQDTLGVIGQFEVDADAQGKVGLGKFFATGHPANSLAEGFKAKLGGQSDDTDAENGGDQ